MGVVGRYVECVVRNPFGNWISCIGGTTSTSDLLYIYRDILVMRVYSGKTQVGNFEEHPVWVDWDDLTHFRGRLASRVALEMKVGRVFQALAIIIWVVEAALLFAGGSWRTLSLLAPQRVVDVLPWVGVAVWMYAMYLCRDRREFNFNLESRNFQSISRQRAGSLIEIDNYLSYEVYTVFDRLLVIDDAYFFSELTNLVLKTQSADTLLGRLGVTASQLRAKTEPYLLSQNVSLETNLADFAMRLLGQARFVAAETIDMQAVFMVLAITMWQKPLAELGVQIADVESLNMWLRADQRRRNYEDKWHKMSVLNPKGVVNRAYTSRTAPTLEKYGEDYTKQAAGGRFSNALGKEAALSEMLKALQRQNNSAVILVGDPGVGKTQLIKHLAVQMVVEDVPKALQDQRLVVFDFNKAFTQNQTLENYKLTLQQIFHEVASARNILLVLDDMDQLLNIRSDLQSEVVNLLVGAIDKQKIRLIATATKDGYTRLIKPVQTLSALFQPIFMEEPDSKVNLQILIDQSEIVERKSGIKIQISALKQIVALAPKYAYEKVMPDKGVDLLEEVVLDAKESGAQYVDAEVVNRLVSRKVGVNVGNISGAESEKLTKLEALMHERVVGQDMAVKAVAAALRRSRAGLSKSSKPVASFLFFGPTGVGKTEMARTLAQTYFGDEKLMIRVDMSEYQEERNLDRLIGYQEGDKFIGGYLTDAVRQKPFSLVLLDEIEKANPKVLDLFLQILDEGFITDGAGRKVDFTNTIIIATSNAGSRQIAEQVAEGMKYDSVYQHVTPVLRQAFRIEFLNRFDKVIMFKPLLPIEVQQIAELMLKELRHSLQEKGMDITYTPKVLEDLVHLGYNPIYGAREIKRVIQEQVEDKIADAVVKGELASGKTLAFEDLGVYHVV